MGAINFLMRLDDKLSGSAKQGKSALAQLDEQMKKSQNALDALEKKMTKLQGGSEVNVTAYKKLSSAIADEKGNLGGLSAQFQQLGGSEALAAEGTSAVGGEMLAMIDPVALAAAAVKALFTILVATTIALISFGLNAANAERSLHLQLQATLGSAQAADELKGTIDELATKTPVLKDKLEAMARALAASDLKGDALKKTLGALAVVAGAVGDEAAGKLQSIIEKSAAAGKLILNPKALAGTGITEADVLAQLASSMHKSIAQVKAAMDAGKISVDQGVAAINAAIQKKLGKVAAAQLLSFDVQLSKLKEHLSDLFEDIKIEDFLKSMKDVLSVFDSTTVTGRALKQIITEAFSWLFSTIAKIGPYAKAFLQGLVIGALLFYIQVKKVGRALDDAFGGGASKVNWIKVAVYAGIGAFGAMVAIVAVLALAFAVVGIAVLLAFLPVILVVAAIALGIYILYEIVEGLIGVFSAAGSAISGMFSGVGAVASSLIDGLVSGIGAGVGAVVAAVMNLGHSAMSALKGVLGIHSPSKVFASLGHFTAKGFAQGIDAGSSAVESSVGSMVATPSTAAAAAPAGGPGRGITINGDIIVHGVKDREDAKRGVLEALHEALDLMSPEPA